MKARSINQRFLFNLFLRFQYRSFRTKDAEEVYHWSHWRAWKRLSREDARRQVMDEWGRMSARNTLVAATQFGKLVRIEKGIYVFAWDYQTPPPPGNSTCPECERSNGPHFRGACTHRRRVH